MKLRKFKTAALAVALTAAAFALLHAQPPAGATGRGRGGGGGFTHATPEDFNDHAGFTSLFDGKTLKGWDGDPRLWSVKDGSIYLNATCEHPVPTVYIVWQGGDVADFDLRVEMKGTGNINSGIQYRSWIMTGPEPPARPGCDLPERSDASAATHQSQPG